MKRILSLALVLLLALSLFGCGTPTTGGTTATTAPAATNAAAQTSAAVTGGASSSAASGSDYALKKGNYVIALSNSYYGNTWRKQMVDAFTQAATEAKSKGYIKDFIVQNGDNTVDSQIQQINSFILQKVDAIVIDPASTTALNAVLQKAANAGIKIITFDCSVTADFVTAVDFDFVTFGYDSVVQMAKLAGENANIVIVRGLAGTSADEQMYQGNMDALKKYPNMKVVATVYGDFSATKTQEELTKILPSLTKVDGVVTQCGGDAYGATQAFAQTDKFGTPIILGDNSAEYLNWWSATLAKNANYNTYSRGTCPSVSSAAFWASLYMLEGYQVPQKMVCSYLTVNKADLSKYANMAAGTIVSPVYAPQQVVDEIIKPALQKK